MVTNDPYFGLMEDREKYGAKFQDHLLDQYRLYVEMADNISNRRASANEFFLTVNTFLLSGLSLASGLQFFRSSVVLPLFAAFVGVTFSFVWIQTVRTYRTLNEVKFELIGRVEVKLPAAMYATEWKVLSARRNDRTYKPLTEVERWVPIVFIALYFFYAITAVILS